MNYEQKPGNKNTGFGNTRYSLDSRKSEAISRRETDLFIALWLADLLPDHTSHGTNEPGGAIAFAFRRRGEFYDVKNDAPARSHEGDWR